MNPKFDFYTLLFKVCSSNTFVHQIAERAIEIYEANKNNISLPNVTLDNLKLWHEQIITGDDDLDIEKVEEIATCYFKDLAAQIRNEPVRKLHHKWKEKAGIPNDLFVRVRRSRDLEGGVATLTVVTDDIAGFQKFFEDPDEFIRMHGEVHFSVADEVDGFK